MKRVRSVFIGLLLFMLILFNLRDLSLGYYPETGRKVLSVTVELEGAWQEDIEELITNPLEEEFGRMTSVKRMISRSEDEKSQIILYLNDDADLEEEYLELRELMDWAAARFPPRTQKPLIQRTGSRDSPVFICTVEDSQLNDEQIKAVLQSVDGVGILTVSSAPKKELAVHYDENRQKMIDPSALVSVIADRTVIRSIPFEGNRTLVLDSRPARITDFQNLYIAPGITIGDLADIRYRNAQSSSIARINGVETTVVWIQESGNANTIELCRELRTKSERLGAVLYDKGALMEAALKETGVILLASVLAVMIITVLLFRRPVAALVLCLGIPFSLGGALAVFNIFGWDVDILVLGGLALSTGMIIDSAVIYMESGFHQSRKAILYSLISTLLVFTPFLFASSLLKLQNIGLIRALCICLTFSVFYILVLGHGFLDLHATESNSLSLNLTLPSSGISKFRKSFILSVFILFIPVCIFSVSKLKFTRNFDLDDLTLSFSLDFPAGTWKQDILDMLFPFEEEMKEWDEIEFFTSEFKEEKAQFRIKLKKGRSHSLLEQKVRNALAKYPGYLFFPGTQNQKSYTLRLCSYNRERLQHAVFQYAGEWADLLPGVEPVFHFKEKPDTLRYIPRASSLAGSSVSPASIAEAMQRQLSPPVYSKWNPPRIRPGDQRSWDIRFLDPAYEHTNLDKLEVMLIPGLNNVYPLHLLTDWDDVRNYGSIEHYNAQRSMSFSFVMSAEQPPVFENLLKARLAAQPLPPGLRIIYDEDAAMDSHFRGELLFLLLLAFILLFVLLVFLFESLYLPLVLSVQIILSHLFSLTVLSWSGMDFSPPVFFALILNTGLLVNNGVLVFGRFQKRRPSREEAVESFSSNSRSLFTAAVTTIVGLLPLLFRSNGNGGMLPALSIVVGSGLIFSLLLIYLSVFFCFSEE